MRTGVTEWREGGRSERIAEEEAAYVAAHPGSVA